MSKKTTKRHKPKKAPELIRTDVWDLITSPIEKAQMLLTVEEYRKYLLPLVLIVNAQWISLADLTSKDRINAVERMIHKTADNPRPKHRYFQSIVNRYPSHRKFPSYLRRAAIADAIGIVSSFQSRYQEWQSGIRVKRDAKPPRLTAMCSTYPALYKGQQIRYNLNYQSCDIKVWSGTDWVWLSGIKIKRHGLTQTITNSKRKKGFCKGLYRKSSNINLEISRKVARGIIELAKTHNVKVIVIETLAGWKAKAGKKGSLIKQKFHLWCHSKIVEIITDRWIELGGKVQSINPKYTSAFAFDGSGKLRRSKTNYSLALFRSGKQYNCDLSASYNIGARYWYCLTMGDKNFSRVFDSQSSNDTLRTPITLDSLRGLRTP